MAGIQLSGLASGLDTASIIDSLMAVERAAAHAHRDAPGAGAGAS